MQNIVLLSVLTTVIFCFIKLFEMKYIEKNEKRVPLKFFVRDIFFVFISSFVVSFSYFKLNLKFAELFGFDEKTPIPIQIFTDKPSF
jgi:hypothetical protein